MNPFTFFQYCLAAACGLFVITVAVGMALIVIDKALRN